MAHLIQAIHASTVLQPTCSFPTTHSDSAKKGLPSFRHVREFVGGSCWGCLLPDVVWVAMGASGWVLGVPKRSFGPKSVLGPKSGEPRGSWEPPCWLPGTPKWVLEAIHGDPWILKLGPRGARAATRGHKSRSQGWGFC